MVRVRTHQAFARILLAALWLTPLASMAAAPNQPELPLAEPPIPQQVNRPANQIPPRGSRVSIPSWGQLKARQFSRSKISNSFHRPLVTPERSPKIDRTTGYYIPSQRERAAINQFWTHLEGQTGLHGYEHAQLYQEGRRNGVQGVHPTYTAIGKSRRPGNRKVDSPKADARHTMEAHVHIHSHPGGRNQLYESPSGGDYRLTAQRYGRGTRTAHFIADWDNRDQRRTFWINPKEQNYRIVHDTLTRPNPVETRPVPQHFGRDGRARSIGPTAINRVSEVRTEGGSRRTIRASRPRPLQPPSARGRQQGTNHAPRGGRRRR
jgi:hypothetical protein